MAKFDKKLAAILTKTKVITEQQRDEALIECDKNGASLTQTLLEKNYCDEATLITSVAEEMNYYPINLSKIDASPDAGMDTARVPLDRPLSVSVAVAFLAALPSREVMRDSTDTIVRSGSTVRCTSTDATFALARLFGPTAIVRTVSPFGRSRPVMP